MDASYKPIACSLHDEYEIAIMHGKHLTIRWVDSAGASHTDKILPKDILVKDKEEFLVVDTQDAKALSIRLDMITILE
jgi:transcriptional antiterminator Rof (Rho-off)